MSCHRSRANLIYISYICIHIYEYSTCIRINRNEHNNNNHFKRALNLFSWLENRLNKFNMNNNISKRFCICLYIHALLLLLLEHQHLNI